MRGRITFATIIFLVCILAIPMMAHGTTYKDKKNDDSRAYAQGITIASETYLKGRNNPGDKSKEKDEDWYEFALEDEALLTITLNIPKDSDCVLKIKRKGLFNFRDNTLDINQKQDKKNKITTFLPRGGYYLCVENIDCSYSVKIKASWVNAPIEHNESFFNAAAASTGVIRNGYLSDINYEDIYRLELKSTGYYYITLKNMKKLNTQSLGQIELSVYDNRRMVKELYSKNKYDNTLLFAYPKKSNGVKVYLEKGTAYVKVRTGVFYNLPNNYVHYRMCLTKRSTKVQGFQVSRGSYGAVNTSWYRKSNAKGYQLKYSRNSKMKNSRTITIKNGSTVYRKLSGLSSGTKYYIKVRSYKVVNGCRCYSKWSSARSAYAG